MAETWKINQAKVNAKFARGEPGIYDVQVTIEGVPLSEAQAPYFQTAPWQRLLQEQGIPARVLFVRPGKNAPGVMPFHGNARGTGGPFDVFGWGEDIADMYWIVRVEILPGAKNLSGLGAISAPIAWAIAAAIVGGFMLVAAFTGKNLIVDGVKFVGAAVKEAAVQIGSAAGTVGVGAAKALVPIILVLGGALWIMKKTGAKLQVPGFSRG